MLNPSILLLTPHKRKIRSTSTLYANLMYYFFLLSVTRGTFAFLVALFKRIENVDLNTQCSNDPKERLTNVFIIFQPLISRKFGVKIAVTVLSPGSCKNLEVFFKTWKKIRFHTSTAGYRDIVIFLLTNLSWNPASSTANAHYLLWDTLFAISPRKKTPSKIEITMFPFTFKSMKLVF